MNILFFFFLNFKYCHYTFDSSRTNGKRKSFHFERYLNTKIKDKTTIIRYTSAAQILLYLTQTAKYEKHNALVGKYNVNLTQLTCAMKYLSANKFLSSIKCWLIRINCESLSIINLLFLISTIRYPLVCSVARC